MDFNYTYSPMSTSTFPKYQAFVYVTYLQKTLFQNMQYI